MRYRQPVTGSEHYLAPFVADVDGKAGTHIREERERRGWSQQQMAAELVAYGISWHQTTVAKVEAGERPLRLSEAWAIAHRLGVSLTELASGKRDVDARDAAVAAAFDEVSVIHRFVEDRFMKLTGELFDSDERRKRNG